jgi:hypothetical protein
MLVQENGDFGATPSPAVPCVLVSKPASSCRLDKLTSHTSQSSILNDEAAADKLLTPMLHGDPTRDNIP